MSVPSRSSLRAQLLWLNVIIVSCSIALSLAGTLYLTLRSERRALDNSLLNSASILSRVPLVAEVLDGSSSREELAAFLNDTTSHVSDIDLILVADTENRIYYAPDSVFLGTHYTGTAQNAVLAGASPYTSNETGPMGSDHSAYAAVRDDSGALLGFVVVGVYVRSMAVLTFQTILRFAGIGLLSAALGSLLANQLSRRIKASLMGYEPDAFARRFHQREDILDALEEGVLAIDREETIIFLNTAAAQMLSLDEEGVVGKSLHTVYPRSTLDRVLRTGKPEYNVSMSSLKDVRVLSDRLPLYEDGRLTGAVGIFRNRTEVTRLADDLTGVRHMVDAMRAYTHEFMNKLHVILGLLQIGEPEKAQQYIMDTKRTQQEAVSRIMHQIGEPSVAALLVGKTSRAGELGIRLTLDRETVARLARQKAEGTPPVRQVIQKDTRVMLGDPAEYPERMVEAICSAARELPAVKALYLRLMVREGEMEPSYLVVVDQDGEQDAVFSAIAGAARPWLEGKTVDLVPRSSRFGQDASKGVSPFYDRI